MTWRIRRFGFEYDRDTPCPNKKLLHDANRKYECTRAMLITSSKSSRRSSTPFDEKAQCVQPMESKQLHRASCHRCGNLRKNNTHCVKCPYTFCSRCTEKMNEEHGCDVFIDGCPVCKQLCCCGKNRSETCSRLNHCYKKCPVSRSNFTRSTREISPTCVLTEFSPHMSFPSKRRHSSPEDTFSPACALIHYRKRPASLTSKLLLQNEAALLSSSDAIMERLLVKEDSDSSLQGGTASPPQRLPGIRSYFEPSPLSYDSRAMSSFQSEFDFLDDVLIDQLDTTPDKVADESLVECSPLTHLINNYCSGIVSANSEISLHEGVDLDGRSSVDACALPEHNDSQAALWIDDICDVVKS